MIKTVDILITVNKKKIILIKRAKEPFMDKLVLPGGHVEKDEDLETACCREAKEEIGFLVYPSELEKLIVLDSLKRDPRPGKRISTVFHVDLLDESRLENCQAESDALAIEIRDIKNISPEMIGFDHFRALEKI